MNIDLLRTFLAVYRAGSITKAAAELHLSQPAVSMHVKALEAAVGRPLFRRLPTGVTPTATGLELARSVGPHVDALVTAVGDDGDADGIAGTVHLGGPEEFLAAHVVPELTAYVTAGGRVRIRVGVDASIVERVATGELDLAITTDAWRDRRFETEHLCHEYLELVGSPTWALHLGSIPTGRAGAAALDDVPIVSFAEELPLIRTYWHTVFERAEPPNAHAIANSLRATMELAACGAGITVLPSHVAQPLVASGRLVRLLTPEAAPRNELHLVWRAGGLRRRAVGRVRDAIHLAAIRSTA